MFRNEKFRALSESLIDGFFADNAILALSKLKKGITLGDDDEGALLECVNFFAKHGNQERSYHCMMLVNRGKLPDVVLQNLIDFFTDFGREKLLETNEILNG